MNPLRTSNEKRRKENQKKIRKRKKRKGKGKEIEKTEEKLFFIFINDKKEEKKINEKSIQW